MSKLKTRNFNYSTLDTETSQFIHQQTVEIKALLKKTAQSIIEIGRRLTEVKQKIGHGKFGSWLKLEFNWSVSAANKFMQVSKEFKFVKFTNLEIAPSALYKLAAPSAPPEARKEALKRAKLGEYVTFTTAKKLIQKYKSSLATIESQSKSNVLQQHSSLDLIASDRLKLEKVSDSSSLNALALFEIPTVKTPSVIPQEIIAAATSPKLPVKQGDLWQLGNKHLLFCGNPQSQQFQKLLPAEVSLSIAFPPRRSDWQNSFHSGAKSAFSLFTVYRDQDLELLKKAVKQLLLLYTSEDDIVVFSYLSEPELLSIGDELNCRCYIAEPNLLLCSAAIAIWQKKTKQTARQLSQTNNYSLLE